MPEEFAVWYDENDVEHEETTQAEYEYGTNGVCSECGNVMLRDECGMVQLEPGHKDQVLGHEAKVQVLPTMRSQGFGKCLRSVMRDEHWLPWERYGERYGEIDAGSRQSISGLSEKVSMVTGMNVYEVEEKFYRLIGHMCAISARNNAGKQTTEGEGNVQTE